MKNDVLDFDWKSIFDRTAKERKCGYDLMFSDSVEILINACNKYRVGYFVDILFEKGEFIFELNNEIHTLSSPTSVVLQPDSEFRFISCANCSIYMLIVATGLRNSFLDTSSKNVSIHSKIKTTPLFPIHSKTEMIEFANCIKGVKDILADINNPYRIEAFRYFNIYRYYRFFYKFYGFDTFNDFGKCNRFFVLLERNYLNERKCEFYAKELNVCPDHLNVILKKKTGKSAKVHLDERLANECKNLLKETELSVETIAQKMGFSSAVVFSKFFKRIVGVTPSKFRK